MNIVLGILIGALIVLFVPFTLPALVGVGLIGMGMYFAPEGFGAAVIALILIWMGLHMLF